MPPVTLTLEQFYAQHPGKKRGSGAYDRYTKYVRHNRPQRRQARLAAQRSASYPNPDETAENRWNSIARLYGKPDPSFSSHSDADLQRMAGADVNAMFGPQIKRLLDDFQARERQGAGLLGAYADKLGGDLGAWQGRDAATSHGFEDSLAGQTNALGAFLGGVGKQQTDEVAGKLAQQGAPESAMANATAAGGIATGAANEAASRGALKLEQMIGDRGAYGSYLGGLPDLVKLSANDTGRQWHEDLASALRESLGDLTSQIPGTSAGILRDYRGQETARATARAGQQSDLARLGYAFLNDEAGRRSTSSEGAANRASAERIAKWGVGVDRDQLDENRSQFDDSLALDQDTLTTNDANADADRTADDANADADRTAKTDAERLAAHTAAKKERDAAIDSARSGTAQLAARLGVGHLEDVLIDEVFPGTTKKTGKKVKSSRTVPGKAWGQIRQQALHLYAPTLRRYGVTQPEIERIVDAGLASAGLTTPATAQQSKPRVSQGAANNPH